MASKYTSEHASALSDVTAAGADITWTRTIAGTVDDATDTETGATTLLITGAAIETEGDRDIYRRLRLTHETGVTLFFTPDDIGEVPLAGDTTTWAGATVTCKEREALAPDGIAIAATVVCAR